MTAGSGELRVVDSVSVGCRGRNEDRLGQVETAAWVMDGATGLASDGGDHSSELQEYLGMVEAALARRLEQGGPTLRDLLKSVIEEAADRFTARFSIEGRLRYELPSAGLALVRQSNGGVEYALLGDCRILAATGGGAGSGLHNLVGSERLRQFDSEVVEEIKARQGEGVTDFPSLRRAVTPRLRANRSLMNTEAGYWVLGLDPRAADRAECGRLDRVDALLLVSDGLYRLVDVFHVLSDAELVRASRSSTLSDLAKWVRTLEASDPDCIAFPRLKVEDDASGLLMVRD